MKGGQDLAKEKVLKLPEGKEKKMFTLQVKINSKEQQMHWQLCLLCPYCVCVRPLSKDDDDDDYRLLVFKRETALATTGQHETKCNGLV